MCCCDRRQVIGFVRRSVEVEVEVEEEVEEEMMPRTSYSGGVFPAGGEGRAGGRGGAVVHRVTS